MNQQEFTAYCASHYKQVCQIALKAGEIMASHGAEAYRIEDTVCRLLQTTGFSHTDGSAENGIYLENPFIRTEQGKSFVYVRGEDGLLEKRFVTTGKSFP